MLGIRPNKRARRGRLQPDDVPIVNPIIEPEKEDSRQVPEAQGTVSVDVGAVTSTSRLFCTRPLCQHLLQRIWSKCNKM